MKSLEYDNSKSGYLAVLKPWQLKAMEAVWGSSVGANSRLVWQIVNKALKNESISRASVINFLEAMREMGVLSGEERTGKGGHHWVYHAKLDEVGFRRYVVETLINSLMENFPEETREAIKKLRM